MSGNFSAYFNKRLFYLFVGLTVFGIGCGGVYLNSQIGHFRAK